MNILTLLFHSSYELPSCEEIIKTEAVTYNTDREIIQESYFFNAKKLCLKKTYESLSEKHELIFFLWSIQSSLH